MVRKRFQQIKATEKRNKANSSEVNVGTATPILLLFTLPVLASIPMDQVARLRILFLHKPPRCVARAVSICNSVNQHAHSMLSCRLTNSHTVPKGRLHQRQLNLTLSYIGF